MKALIYAFMLILIVCGAFWAAEGHPEQDVRDLYHKYSGQLHAYTADLVNQVRGRDETSSPVSPQYEYKVTGAACGTSCHDANESLNHLAAKGWRVIGVIPWLAPGQFVIVCERVKP